MQSVAKKAISNIENIQGTIIETQKALIDECVSDIGVMAYDMRHTHFSHIYFTNDLQKNMMDFTEWNNDPFYQKCIEAKDVIVLKLSEFNERTNPKHLVGMLYLSKISFVVIIPFSSLRIKGFLIIPSPQNISGTSTALLERLPEFHIESLKAYAAVLGSCVETAESHLTSERARRLIGQIGHEVQSPVAELGQSALEILYRFMDYLSEIENDYTIDVTEKINEMEKEESIIGLQMKHINTLMNVAVDMAQESKGTIQVHFSKYDLYDVMRKVSDSVEKESYYDYKGNEHAVRFVYNNACQKMNPLVGDVNLLRKVFENVFRNAVKYSLPRYYNEPIKIEIYGQPQTGQNIVQIKNWGIAIPEDIREKIFIAFERGELHDRLKARRGMGLGLYIARHFLLPHKGTILCLKSEPTLRDPNRKDVEGWETIFEIRLPFGLKIGTYDEAY